MKLKKKKKEREILQKALSRRGRGAEKRRVGGEDGEMRGVDEERVGEQSRGRQERGSGCSSNGTTYLLVCACVCLRVKTTC